ncbi:MAG: SprB repeat-containing protein [Bacteroidota bacterium]
MRKTRIKYRSIIYLTLFLLCNYFSVYAQSDSCGPNTPSFIVDLTGNPDSVWISPDTSRADQCCGATFPDRCIEFWLTLDPEAEAIIFDIYSGAVPPGALYYQVECSNPIPVGEKLCIAGVGPHRITFCKPGNNDNQYTILSIPKPSVSPGIAINEGCTGIIYAMGYDISTIIWTSVYPGSTGDYDSYLSCTSGCDTVVVTAQIGFPPFVDYQVCGTPAGGCDSLLEVCDTVRIYFNTELFAEILPEIPTICFGDTSVTITANGIGGTPPYTYFWSTGDTTQSVNVNTGTYWVMVADTSYPGCPPAFDTTTVTSFASSITAYAGPDQTVCVSNDSIQLSGTVTAASGGIWSGGNGTFIPAADSLNTIYIPSSSEITSGSVTLVLTTTGNGSCPAVTDTVTITLFTFGAAVGLMTSNISCNGFSDGSATVTTSGGAPPFTYQWDDPAAQTDSAATGLDTGVYTVIITDVNGCDTTLSIVITEPLLLAVDISDSANASCYGSNDGSATLTASGGTAPYSYLWNDISAQTNATATGLTAGTYSVTVTDSNGCTASDSIILTEPDPLTANITASTNISCNGFNDGSATLTTSGGTPPYTYVWDTTPFQSSTTATGLAQGIYNVTVTDSNGCDTTTSVTIIEPPLLTANITGIIPVSCYGGNDGSATLTASGGTAPYSYLWDNNDAQTTATATGLTAATYSVTVTDNNGCNITVSVVINEPAALSANISSITDVGCYGGSDGSAMLTSSGGTPLYTYSWNTSPVQTSATATGLEAGNYSVTVTDANGCDTTLSIIISEPSQLIATITSRINASCNGYSNGEAIVTPIGGISPYTYQWNDPNSQTSATATGLYAGMYTATVTDNNGCNALAIVIINEPAILSFSISTTPANCGNADGEACVTASGGIPPYTYFWNTAPVQNTSCATGLPAGCYDIIVTDSNGCAAIGTVCISDLAITITVDWVNNITCYGGNDGGISITASGSTPPYSYSWNTNPLQTGSTATGLTAGSYTVTVTDANGCQATLTATVSQPLPIIPGINTIDVNCNGSSDGEASVIASGESPPYTYSWNTSPLQTGSTATGLSAGNYAVTVTDAIGCNTTMNAVINEPPLLIANITSSTDITCYGANDGSATVTSSGGIAPYTYLWNDGMTQTTTMATSLSPGNYTVTVTDANGCITTASVMITEPPLLIASITSITNISCNGLCDGSATLTASGGTPPYTYFWNTTPFQTGTTATGLCPGNYTVSVVDANDCNTTAGVTITEPPVLTGSITSFNNVSCNGVNDGNATVTPTGGTQPYTYINGMIH